MSPTMIAAIRRFTESFPKLKERSLLAISFCRFQASPASSKIADPNPISACRKSKDDLLRPQSVDA